jgi:N-methylhydantoinase B
VSFLAERTRFAAPGVAGGKPGRCGKVTLNWEEVDPKRQYVLKRGDMVGLATPGGGGYGPPSERNPGARERDIDFGYVEEAGDEARA